MPKLLLVRPPIRDFYTTVHRLEPLGLEYLATAAEKAGWGAEILDCIGHKRPKILPLPASMEYLRDHYSPKDRSPFALFRNYQHFGMDEHGIEEALKSSNPDAVAISAMFTAYQQEALDVAKICRKIQPEIPVILGGGFPTCEPEKALSHPAVDYIIIGEGEIPLGELLAALEGKRLVDGIAGVGQKKDGRPTIGPPVFAASIPERVLKFFPGYSTRHIPKWGMIQTSRGCPHHCRFCSSKLMFPGPFRQREVRDVIHEMQTLHNQFPEMGFDFEDDNLTYDRAWILKLCGEIVRCFGRKRLELAAMNGLCPADLDKERLRALADAGFRRLELSLGLYGKKQQEANRRPAETPEVISAVRLARQLELDATVYFILGMPGQRLGEVADMIHELSCEPGFLAASVFYPVPGTSVFDDCLARNRISPSHPELWRSSCIPVETDDLNRVDIVTFLRILRMIHFLKKFATAQQIGSIGKRKSEMPIGASADQGKIGLWMAEMVLREKVFFSLRLDEPGHLQVEELPTSKRVMEAVFGTRDLSWIKPAHGIRLDGYSPSQKA